MNITAKIIEGINYKSFLLPNLPETEIENFDINDVKSSSIILLNKNRFAVSKWVSPKRTRSYPYERVYNTLSASKKITVIPVVKDEGLKGDRDFLQWDTVSLMSLLDIFVVLAYYDKAEKHLTRANKITKQKFNNTFVLEKIREINDYHSSALHWNLKELRNITSVLNKVQESHKRISDLTDVKIHSPKGLENFTNKISKSLEDFMESSRIKSESAQLREFVTIQPKEILSTSSKAKITITNYLGGKYFFTVDETVIEKDNICLIEAKHTKSGKLPSLGDIKDGLLKMMLYTNLENLKVNEVLMESSPVLLLTSGKIKGKIRSNSSVKEIKQFVNNNSLNEKQAELMSNLFVEANHNNFTVNIEAR